MSTKKDSQSKGNKNPGKDANDGAIGFSQERSTRRPAWRDFPGPARTETPLRVAMRRTAYAEITAHAHESLDAEVAGILAGELYEDQHGVFVDVQGVVKALATRAGNVHVTFTQQTWNEIHTAMERDYPGLQIVGWYHTHPGLGVEFSDMDVFIQKNFFSLPTHLALLYDPLGGDLALAANATKGIQYLDRFWVEGREKRCRAPEERSTGQGSPAIDQKALEKLETRIGQLTKAFDDMRTGMYRVVLSLVFFVALSLVSLIGYGFYNEYTRSLAPPRLSQTALVPVRLGDQVLLLDVAVVGWDIRDVSLKPQQGTGIGTDSPSAGSQTGTEKRDGQIAAPASNDKAGESKTPAPKQKDQKESKQ